MSQREETTLPSEEGKTEESPPLKKQRKDTGENNDIDKNDLSKPPGFSAVEAHWRALREATVENRAVLQRDFDEDPEGQNRRARDPTRNTRERLLLFFNAINTAFKEEFNEFFPFIQDV